MKNMNKKLIISLSIIGVVAAVAIGGTIAYFNDVETSTGNILIAGTMDLKVDHTKQTYNDADCKTCSVTVISDPTNMVVEKFGSPITPYPAVYVGSVTGFIHSAWTAEEDPILQAAGAKWIWESDPTRDEDLTNNVTYTFQKTFEWWGPIVNTDLYMAVGSDNSVEVWLNGTKIGENTGEYGYKKGSMLHIPAANITPYILQGNNVLEFIVKNWALAGSTWKTNPAGLVYKFSIDGLCGDDWFKTHCRLWGLKDLEQGDYFWNLVDVKPGDDGLNIISLHAYDNDAYACIITNNIVDAEDVVNDAEIEAGDDIASVVGELSQFIKIFAWEDSIQNNSYDGGENILVPVNSPLSARAQISLTASNTKDIGLAWCAGTQSLNGNQILCDGSSMGNIAQSDIMTADITAYAEQQRNNPNFNCANVTLP